jgi:3',5'-cyclic AMP phosphodiesterase CpdA
MSNSPHNSRRQFIKNISFATALIAGGSFKSLTASEVFDMRKKVALRFVVASDFHYGQPKTEFEAMADKVIAQINLFHQTQPLDFCVMNGDLIHNEKQFLPQIKAKLDGLPKPYFVTRGNHDMVSADYWKEIWTTPLHHSTTVKDAVILLCDTSNEKGEYLSPDLIWLKAQLEQHKKAKQVFLFVHIPQVKWTANGIDTPGFYEILKQYPNIKAVFHGHEHDQDGHKMVDNLPFMFDAHVGGNWGTPYKGFRVIEMMKDGSMVSYMMNPTEKMNEISF